MTTADVDEDYSCLTTEGVHQLTGIATGTLRAWRHRADGSGPPSFRLHGVVVYRRALVLQWIKDAEEAEQERRQTGRTKRNG